MRKSSSVTLRTTETSEIFLVPPAAWLIDSHCADVHGFSSPRLCIILRSLLKIIPPPPSTPMPNFPYLLTPVADVVIPPHLTSHPPASSD